MFVLECVVHLTLPSAALGSLGHGSVLSCSQLRVKDLDVALQLLDLVLPLAHLQPQHHHVVLHHFGDLRHGSL